MYLQVSFIVVVSISGVSVPSVVTAVVLIVVIGIIVVPGKKFNVVLSFVVLFSCGVVVAMDSDVSMVESSSVVDVIKDVGGVIVSLVVVVDEFAMIVSSGVVVEILVFVVEWEVVSEKIFTSKAIL